MAKFTNYSNFFREVGRGSGVLERSLEIAEVLWGGGRRWWRQEAGQHTPTTPQIVMLWYYRSFWLEGQVYKF